MAISDSLHLIEGVFYVVTILCFFIGGDEKGLIYIDPYRRMPLKELNVSTESGRGWFINTASVSNYLIFEICYFSLTVEDKH